MDLNDSSSIGALSQERAVKLFQFLRSFANLKAKPQRTLDNAEVLWFADVPKEPECVSITSTGRVTGDTEDVWLEVHKPKVPLCPEPPEEVLPWLKTSLTDPEQEPALREQLVRETQVQDDDLQWQTIKETLFLDEQQDVLLAWDAFMDHWRIWAAEQQRVLAVQKVYARLFSFYQRQQALGESWELIVGLGLLRWRTPKGHEVRRHLLAAQAALHFDPARGLITLAPAGNGARTAVEMDMLETGDGPLAEVVRLLEDQLQDVGEDVWDQATMPGILKTWVNATGGSGVYDEGLSPPAGKIATTPTVTWAPALVLRPRGERSLGRAFQAISYQLEQAADLHVGLRSLVDIRETPTMGQLGQAGTVEEEIYFPLATNEEQRHIIRQLRHHDGVLVQGPPGTGKSHTIVNLVSHLLATNQKVLVTSHTSRALKVLRDKFPKELAALCVTHLQDEAGAKAALEQSVHEIMQRYNLWSAEQAQTTIVKLQHDLEVERQKEALALEALREIREEETLEHHDKYGYNGTAQAIGSQLRNEEHHYHWLSEYQPQGVTAPLSNDEALELLGLLREIDDRREAELRLFTPDLGALPTPAALAHIVDTESIARDTLRQVEEARRHPSFAELRSLTNTGRDQYKEALKDLHGRLLAMTASHVPWAPQAVEQVLKGQVGMWEALQQTTQEQLAVLSIKASWADATQATGLEGRDAATVRSEAHALLEHLKSGGGWGFLGLIKPKPVQQGLYLKQGVKLNGQPCDAVESLTGLVDLLDVQSRQKQLETAWMTLTTPPLGTLLMKVAQYREWMEFLEYVLALRGSHQQVKEAHAAAGLTHVPAWWRTDELQMQLLAIQAVEFEQQLKAATQAIDAPAEQLNLFGLEAGSVHPGVQQLQLAIEQRDVQRYGHTYQKLSALVDACTRLARRDALIARLGQVAPQLMSDLSTTRAYASWEERFKRLDCAWRWMQADTWLRRLSDPETQVELFDKLAYHRTRIRDLLRGLAAERAWDSSLQRMTKNIIAHLSMWQLAIKKLGKGTGKNAAKYRNQAREALQEARHAIPAWIMPVHTVVEHFEASPGMFDVVIVDEASQAGPEALFLAYIGKKVIVVGDDEQIEPSAVGIKHEDVDALVQQHLSDFPAPLRAAIGAADASLFSIARVAFGKPLMLQEHFRCMPEIIAFSNKLCYAPLSTPLIPLRQYGATRLPPVLARYVPGAHNAAGTKLNHAEAQAIVQQIKACCADPRYQDRSMGVISLIGEDQARLIETMLLMELGPEEMQRRQLICGNPYDFQGDERDVMFLSVVTPPSSSGHKIGKIADKTFKSRFNVAASRARDQMWLFHSVTLDQLNPEDLRAQLIKHCQNPDLGLSTALAPGALLALKQQAEKPGRGQYEPPKPFDSWFELDVYLDIVGRGYRVIPQYEVNQYRIDMVVEGLRGKLAVECDGDYWHGLEQYKKDMVRQQTLERAGWTFWRVRGSTYGRDPEAALEDLWIRLDELSVFPEGDERNDMHAFHTTVPEKLEVSNGVGTSDGLEDLQDSPAPEAEAEPSPLAVAIASMAARQVLEPYAAWHATTLPDPRTATSREVLSGLQEIIDTEGPMTVRRAFQLYVRGAGIQRLGREVKAVLNRRLADGVRQDLFVLQDDWEKAGQIDKIVRVKGAPSTRLRERGPRDLQEVPPSELAVLIRHLLKSGEHEVGEYGYPELLFRSVLSYYGAQRLTVNTRTALERALTLVEAAEAENAAPVDLPQPSARLN